MTDPRCFVVALFLLAVFSAEAKVPMSERVFHDFGVSKGIVILQVHWGRYWNCGLHQNAQLQRLAFQRQNPGTNAPTEKEWELSPGSTLFAKPTSDISVAEVGSSELIVNGKPVGGSFNIDA